MTGSLQEKNGKYYVVISYKDANGKHKCKWVSTDICVKNNKKKAEEKMFEILQEYKLKEKILSRDMLFSDYVSLWLERAKIKVDIITYNGYSAYANNHIIPYFAAKRIMLSELNREHIQKYVYEKYDHGRLDGRGGLSPKTIHSHMIVISQACIEAVKSGLLNSSPCVYIDMPKSNKRAAQFYSDTEMKELFEAIKNERLYPLYYFTALFGLRRSEVLGLKWDSVDFENKLLTIKHTVVQYEGIVEKDSTKNDSSYRSFPIVPKVETILLELKKDEEENGKLFGRDYNKNDYIFKWENGKPYEPDFVSKKFEKLLKQNNLRRIRFHDLRHSCASMLVSAGYQIKDVQEWLGHADISTTANIYAHLDSSRKQAIATSMFGKFNF